MNKKSLATLRITEGITVGDTVTVNGKTVEAIENGAENFAKKIFEEIECAESIDFKWEAKPRRWLFWYIMEAVPVWIIKFSSKEVSEYLTPADSYFI